MRHYDQVLAEVPLTLQSNEYWSHLATGSKVRDQGLAKPELRTSRRRAYPGTGALEPGVLWPTDGLVCHGALEQELLLCFDLP